jgi:hypothetical protein
MHLNATNSSMTTSAASSVAASAAAATIAASIKNYHQEYLVLTIKLLIIFFTAFLNGLLIYIFTIVIKRCYYSNLIFLSIAVSDFVVGSLSMTTQTLIDYMSYWPFGKPSCLLSIFMQYAMPDTTIIALLALAMHRYSQLRSPSNISESMSARLNMLKVASIWLVPNLFWLAAIVALVSVNKWTHDECDLEPPFAFALSKSLVFNWLPLMLIILFNILCVRALNKKRKRFVNYVSLISDKKRTKAATAAAPSAAVAANGSFISKIISSLKRRPTTRHQVVRTKNKIYLSNSNLNNETLNEPMCSKPPPPPPLQSLLPPASSLPRKSLSLSLRTNRCKKVPSDLLRNKEKRDRKAFMCMLALTLSIIGTQIIYLTTWPLYKTQQKSADEDDLLAVFYQVGTWLSYLTSLTNPILLVLFHGKVKAETVAILKRARDRLAKLF